MPLEPPRILTSVGANPEREGVNSPRGSSGRRDRRSAARHRAHHWTQAVASIERPTQKAIVIIGTLGRHAALDVLIDAGKLDAGALRGKWESFVITTVAKPFAGVDEALVSAGSDRRGTMYGVYE